MKRMIMRAVFKMLVFILDDIYVDVILEGDDTCHLIIRGNDYDQDIIKGDDT